MKCFIIGSYVDNHENSEAGFSKFSLALGKAFASKKISILLCSPFEDSVDFNIINGISQSKEQKLSIELHYVKTPEIDAKWGVLISQLKKTVSVTKFGHQALINEGLEDWKNSWLFCQIQSIQDADFIVCVGGNLEGPSNLLLRIAETQRKRIVPLPKFGGVGEAFFNKMLYQLKDYWGPENFGIISACESAPTIADILTNSPQDQHLDKIMETKKDPVFFISYSRHKPSDADFVEMILRRRNFNVIRDETNISPTEDIPNSIREAIHKSDVFIALWNREYACSPWCYDELDIAVNTHLNKPNKSLWILKLDETRMVHPKLRNCLYYDIQTRVELEGRIAALLGEFRK